MEAAADSTFPKVETTSLSPPCTGPASISISPTPFVEGRRLEERDDAFDGEGVTFGEGLFYTFLTSLALGAVGAAGVGMYECLKPQRNPTPVDIPLEDIERHGPGSSQNVENAHEPGQRDFSEAGRNQVPVGDSAAIRASESQGEEGPGDGRAPSSVSSSLSQNDRGAQSDGGLQRPTSVHFSY
jgi:hypothetical protein